MRAGLLTEHISIYKPYNRDTQYGKSTKTDYIPYISDTKANVMNKRKTRTYENDEIDYPYTVTFKIRGYHKIDDYMRIKWKDNFYRIVNIFPPTFNYNEIQIDAEIVHE